MEKLLSIFNKVPLEDQYKGFRILFWIDIVLATVALLFGGVVSSLVLFIIGLQLGQLSNQKLVLINQEKFLANQEIFKSKLEELRNV